MINEKAAARTIADLRAKIARHEHQYRIELETTITDNDYDAMVRELNALEKQFPQLAERRTLGSDIVGNKPTVEHLRKMLSLDSTESMADLHAFAAPHFIVDPHSVPVFADLYVFSVEHKLDGMAVSARYDNGRLSYALTRGTGEEGEDITRQFICAIGVPQEVPVKPEGLPDVRTGPLVEVRGEIVIMRANFDAYNEQALAEGERVYANPRAMAAAAMRTGNLDKVRAMRPHFIVYDVAGLESDGDDQSAYGYSWADHVGFQAVRANYVSSGKELEDAINQIEQDRPRYAYDIDGAVVKASKTALREKLGEGRQHPHWAMAYKFKAQEAFSDVLGVVAQTGRTGLVTPVLKVTPVPLGGVTIKSITLHNPMIMLRHGIRVGDRVVIRRAKDVIPQLVKVLPRGDGLLLPIPTLCPCCGTALVEAGEARMRCPNNLGCEAQAVLALHHFAGKLAMDIDGFGGNRIQQLYKAGYLRSLADFYRLTAEQLCETIGCGVKVASKLLEAIDVSKFTTLPRLLTGFNIPGVSKVSAEYLAKHFNYDLTALMVATEEAFAQVTNIEAARAAALVAFFEVNTEAVSDLVAQGITWPTHGVMPTEEPQPLTGLTLVVTGRFWATPAASMPRNHVQDFYRQYGATVDDSVSKRTDFLITGERPGENKITHANALGVAIVTVEDFRKRYELPHFNDPT